MPEDTNPNTTPPTTPPAGTVTDKAAAPAPAAAAQEPTLLEYGVGWLIAQAVNLVFLLALWAVLAVGLRLVGVEWANALGFGFLVSFFGGFMFRPLVVGAMGKKLASKVPGLMPPPQPQPGTPVEGAREVGE